MIETIRGWTHAAGLVLAAQLASLPLGAQQSPVNWSHLSSAFGDLPAPPPNGGQAGLRVIDLDQDGQTDYVLEFWSTNALIWYRRAGATFVPYVIEPDILDLTHGEEFKDIDNDGDIDLIFGQDASDNGIYWWENPHPNYDPGTRWVRRTVRDTGGDFYHDNTWGDFDGDGKDEFIAWNQGGQQLLLFEVPADPKQPGAWPVTAIFSWSTFFAGGYRGVATVDINLDGKIDFVGGGGWFQHNSGTSYTFRQIDPNMRSARLVSGQLIAGGRPEVVCVQELATGPLNLYFWNGASWQATTLLANVARSHTLELGDINGDGHLDILWGEMGQPGDPPPIDPAARTMVLYGNGAGQFVQQTIFVGQGTLEAKLGDIDNDGDLDILGNTFRHNAPRIDFWINEGFAPLIQPKSGAYPGHAQVALSGVAGQSFRYTTDGSAPGPGSALYTAPFVLSSGATVRAAAFTNGVALPGVSTATYTILAESDRPALVGAYAFANPARVNVVFAEPLDQNSAETPANYQLDQGVSVLNATLDVNRRTVVLATSPLAEGATYNLAINNVADAALNPIAPGTQIPVDCFQVPSSGQALWLRGDAGIELGAPGLVSWRDQSGQNRHASQNAGFAQPRVRLGSVNGLPAVAFDAVNDFMTFNLPVNGLSGMTIFLVAANTQPQNGGEFQHAGLALFWNQTVPWGTVYLGPYQTNVNFRFGTTQTGNRFVYNRPSSVGSAFTLSTSVKNGTTDSLFVNRVLAVSEGGKLASIDGCQPTGNLGRGFDDDTFFAGEIAEVLVFDRALTATERIAVEQYLDSKYSLTTASAPQIVAHPGDLTVVDPNQAVFSVTATGSSPLTYQWRRNGMNIPGATGSAYVLNPTSQAADNGALFDVLVSNPAGVAISAAAVLTVDSPAPAPPQITNHPANRTVTEPNEASFSVSATGSAPLSYQWRRNGVNIPGATSSAYVLSPTSQAADNGAQFDVLVSNALGSVASQAATLTVNLPSPRVTAGLVTLYDFAEGSGTTVHDVSGVGAPLDLTILDPARVQWLGGGSNGVRFASTGSAIRSPAAAGKIHNALTASGRLTLEAWLAPANLTQNGPARIVTISGGSASSQMNLHLGQGSGSSAGDMGSFRLRTSANSFSWLQAGGVFTSTVNARHVVLTYDGAMQRIYVDGVLAGTLALSGDLSPWNSAYPLLLGNEASLDRSWLGTLYLVAVYDRALSLGEIQQNYSVGTGSAPGPMPPQITSQPANASVVEPNSASFSVTATGSTPLSYQWRRNGVNIPGATGSSYTLNPTSVTEDNGAQFSVVVTNQAGSATSQLATLTVSAPPTPPQITGEPADLTVQEPNGATFSVTATGTAPLSYQWRRGGVNIPGATGATYVLNPTSQGADNGAQFSVLVSNGGGSVASAVATLTVTSPPPTPPQITSHPASVAVTEPNGASFSVTATGTAPLSYQWRRNGGNISGATGSTYVLNPTSQAADNGAQFDVVVSNGVGSVNSQPATLTVNAPNPRVTDGLVALYDFAEGAGTTVHDVSGVGTPLDLTILDPARIQWLGGVSNGVRFVSTGSAIRSPAAAGKIHNALTASSRLSLEAWLTPASLSQTGPARIVTVSGGNASSQMNLHLGQGSGSSGGDIGSFRLKTSDNAFSWLQVGGVFNSTVNARHVVLTYDGTTQRVYVDGMLAGSLSLSGNFVPWDSGYPLIFGNEAGLDRPWLGTLYLVAIYDRQLSPAEIQQNFGAGPSVATHPVPPAITSQPANVSVLEPNPASFSVMATGTPPLSYQWRRNGVNIPGGTGSTYLLSPTSQEADNGAMFDVVVANGVGSVTSASATLTVTVPQPTPPQITAQPASVSVSEPTGATFSVTATGTAPLAYQWRRNGVNIPGATASSYVLSPTSHSADNGAQFDVVVSNAVGSVTSQQATLTVVDPNAIPQDGLGLWLRADTGLVRSGSMVSQWTDQSGNNRHAVQASSASQPVCMEQALNGLPVLRFDGLNDFLTFNLPVNGLTGMSIFLVAANLQNQTGGAAQAERAALFWNETSAWGTIYVSPFQSIVNMRFGTTQAGNRISYARPASVGNSFTLTSAIKDGTTDALYVNGTLVLSEGGKLASIAGCRSMGNLARGYNDNTFYAGDIAEVLVYDRALSGPEQAAVEQYLDFKYGLTGVAGPSITSQPASVSVEEPNAAMFTVGAAGTGPLSYQWRRNGSNIPGATSASYTLNPTSVAADNGAQFDVVVSNIAGSVTSAAATLTVTAPVPTPPQITSQPANFTAQEPNPATFNVTASGTEPLSYQWRRGGVNIPGATSASYTLNPTSVAADDGAQFDVVVSNGAGSTTSQIATLTVIDPNAFPQTGLALWLRADSGTVLNGSTVSQWSDQSGNNRHAAQASGPSQPLWVDQVLNGLPVLRFDGAADFLTFNLPVNGLSGMSVFLVAAATQEGSSHPAERAALFWNETAAWGTLFVSPFPSAVKVRFGTGQSNNQINHTRAASIGSSFSLTSAIKDGATDRVYVNGSLAVSEGGKLDSIAACRATGNVGRGFDDNTFYAGDIAEILVYTRALSPSEQAAVEQYLDVKYGLTVVAPPSITSQPASLSVQEPNDASFSVSATGPGPLSYQWRRGGVNIPGATSSTYVLSPTSESADDGAQFDVIVSNAHGSVMSQSATLTVTPPPPTPPQITSQPVNTTVTEPGGASFSVTATGTAPLSYQWRRNGANIGGATSSTYTLNPTSRAADNGAQFSVVVSNSQGSVTSATATLTVLEEGNLPQTGLALWLRADSGVVITGGAVSQWTDQSPFNRHAVQNNLANRPTLLNAAVNGLPALRFDGTDDFLLFNMPVNGLTGMSIFMVASAAQNGGTHPAHRAALFWNETAGWSTLFLSPFPDSVHLRFGTTQPFNDIIYARPLSVGGDFTLTTGIKNGTVDSLFVNRAAVVTATGKLGTIAGCRDVGNVGRGLDDNTYYSGDIAEILVYNRALSAVERDSVEQYLDSKYSLTTPLAPQFGSTPQTLAAVGVLYEYRAAAYGNPAPSYSLITAPAGMTINSSSGMIQWTPTVAQEGTHQIQVRATNPLGTDTQTFMVDVGLCPIGLISYFPLDEVSGEIFQDAMSVNNAFCVAPECPTPVAGRVDGGQFHNGATTRISALPHPSMDLANNDSFTFAAWVRTDTLGETAYVGRIDTGNMMEVSIGQDEFARPWFYLRDSAGRRLTNLIAPGSSPPLGVWHYVVGVRNATTEVASLYVDGVLVNSKNTSSLFLGDFASPSATLDIGWLNLSHGYDFGGILDEIAIYRRALSPEEISANYNKGVMGLPLCAE